MRVFILILFRAVIDRMCELIDVSGNVDAWWDVPVASLLQDDSRNLNYEKGKVKTQFKINI